MDENQMKSCVVLPILLAAALLGGPPMTVSAQGLSPDVVQQQDFNPMKRRTMSRDEVREAFGESKPNPAGEHMSNESFIFGWLANVILKFILLAGAVFGGRYLWRRFHERLRADEVAEMNELASGRTRTQSAAPVAVARAPRGSTGFGKRG